MQATGSYYEKRYEKRCDEKKKLPVQHRKPGI